MENKSILNLVFISVLSLFAFCHLTPLHAQGTPGAGDMNLFSIQVNPNVLIILDNSNSMDEDFYGNGVGSYSPSSKSANARNLLNNLPAILPTGAEDCSFPKQGLVQSP